MLDIDWNAYRLNPYPYFKKMRAESPLYQIKSNGYWAVSRYTDVKKILKNPDIFSSTDIAKEPSIISPEFLLYSRGLIGTDKPDHTRLRRFLSKTLTQKMMRESELTIRTTCQSILHNVPNQQPIDFIDAFAVPLPIMVIAELMGIDIEKKNDFKRWATLLITWRNQPFTSDIQNDIEHMFYYFMQLIAARKKAPKTDLISALVLACDNDEIITSEEVLAFLRLLLVAGTDTTTHLLGNAMLALLNHPHYIEQIRHNIASIPNFIEELLRYDSPVLCLSRRVNCDIDINGITLQKNDIVLPLLASANHDETVFPHPECFDMERDTRSHLTFGTGIHHCFGSQLARLIARIAFEEIFTVSRFFERTNDEPLSYLPSFFFRGLKRLDIFLDFTCNRVPVLRRQDACATK